MRLSLVIPLYNEEKLIEELFERTVRSMEAVTGDFEIICIDDGSTDTTLAKLVFCHSKDERFKVLTLSRNFGHQAAYTAGLAHAKGDYVIMLDGDMQDPPEMVKDLYEKLVSESLDIVYGRRIERQESFFKKQFIRIFHFIFTKTSNIKAPANVGNFSIMTRGALNALLSLKEKNRYLPGLRFFIGFRQGFVDYRRDERTSGQAKMSFSKLTKLALDAIFSFSNIPIKLCILIGMAGILFTIIGAGIVIGKKVVGDAISGWTSTLLSMYFLGSVQLLFLGIIGEYIHRIFVETQDRPIYIVRDFYSKHEEAPAKKE